VDGYQNKPRIVHGGGRACYLPAEDRIDIPSPEAFSSPEEYYSTFLHELAHSTGAYDRLNRRGVTDPIAFGSHGYSFEELVAECSSAFLCAEAGISAATLQNSAAYIGSWIKRLQSEPRWVVQAAAQASKAADLVLGRTGEPTVEASEAA
jgi:antirestriction protein ArdC